MPARLIPALFAAALSTASAPLPASASPLKPVCPGAQGPAPATRARLVSARVECEWCGAAEAPARLGSSVRLADHTEPGAPLVLSGRVLRADGRTPAAGVLLYIYHTNQAGAYPTRGGETGNGHRHGYLRGWLRTDAQGRYCVSTIRPGHYPGRPDPGHLHVTVQEPGGPEGYIDDFVFDDDPRVTAAYRARVRNRGGSGITRLTRGPDGVWRGERTIVLRDVGR